MGIKKLKKTANTKVQETEQVAEEVVETTEVVEDASDQVHEETEEAHENLTPDEAEAIQEQQENAEKEGADTQRLKIATALLSEKFNLDNSYHVTKFDDKGKVMNLTMENREFVINVQIKDSGRHGLTVYED